MNRLSLHLGKTESILFGTKQKIKQCSQMSVYCNNIPIQAKKNVKYLGITFDQDLSGDKIGRDAVRKINNGLKFLYRNGQLLSRNEKRLLCSTLLQPYFDYACVSWYWGINKYRNRLQTAQNKMVRYTLALHPRAHVGADQPVLLKWLDVSSRVEFLALSLIYKFNRSEAPDYFHDLRLARNLHTYNTRRSQLSYVLPHVGGHGKQTFYFNGVKVWNQLPHEIKSSTSKYAFKYKCKQFMTDRMVDRDISVFVSH